ncbi:MAG: hypothetical protein QXM16_05725 [Nitrososphaerota archaeon]
MRYTVQSGTYGLYIQTYASFLENVVEDFKMGKPALLSVKIIKDDGRVYTYYCHYGGGQGKLNISVPEWFAEKGEKLRVFFKVVSPDDFIRSIPVIILDEYPDKPRAVVDKVFLDNGKNVLKLFVKQLSSEGEFSKELVAENPIVGYDPRGVEMGEGRYAGAPYVQFTIAGKTFRIYYNHGKTRFAIGSGRNFYTIKRIEIDESNLNLYYQKKEKKARIISTVIELEKLTINDKTEAWKEFKQPQPSEDL